MDDNIDEIVFDFLYDKKTFIAKCVGAGISGVVEGSVFGLPYSCIAPTSFRKMGKDIDEGVRDVYSLKKSDSTIFADYERAIYGVINKFCKNLSQGIVQIGIISYATYDLMDLNEVSSGILIGTNLVSLVYERFGRDLFVSNEDEKDDGNSSKTPQAL